MSTEKIKFGRSNVFFDPFERRPGPIKTNMHYLRMTCVGSMACRPQETLTLHGFSI